MNIKADIDSWSPCLTGVGISAKGVKDVEYLATKLRTVFVEELLGEHRDSYVIEQFFTGEGSEGDYSTEARRFL